MTFFDDAWAQSFGELPLQAHELRVLVPERWVRFHSLPESKRYAGDEAETAEILRRWNLLVTEVLAPASGWMITTGAGPERVAELVARLQTQPVLLERGFRWSHFDPVLPLHGWSLRWRPGLLDPWFRLLADSEVYNTLILDAGFQRLLAPYDGGIDLILANPAERDRMRDRHSEWLSRHPSGT